MAQPTSSVKDLIARFNRGASSKSSVTAASTAAFSSGGMPPRPPAVAKQKQQQQQQKEEKPRRRSTLQKLSAAVASAFSSTGKASSSSSGKMVEAASQQVDVMMSLPLIGVSLKWFLNFIKNDSRVVEIVKEKGENVAMMDDILKVIVEMTAEKDDVSIGEMLRRNDPSMMKDVADVFISYARKYLVVDVIGCMESLLEGEKKKGKDDIFIWFDSLCVNQRVHKIFDPDFFINALRKAIETISRVIVIACPWDNPANLTRSWCLWELYCATLNENTEVEIMITPSQRDAFRQALRLDALELVGRIGKIDVTKAEAFNKDDQEMILNAARTAKGGIEAVQESVVDPIRKWMIKESKILIDKLEARGDSLEEIILLYNQVALLLGEQRLYDAQEQYGRKALELSKKLYGDDHPNVASSLNNLAFLLCDQEKYDEAESLYRESLSVLKKTYGNDDSKVMPVLNNLANLLSIQGKYEDAEPLHREVLAKMKELFGDKHLNAAASLHNLANLLQKEGKYGEAEQLYREAFAMIKQTLGDDHPYVVMSSNNLASLLQEQGKVQN